MTLTFLSSQIFAQNLKDDFQRVEEKEEKDRQNYKNEILAEVTFVEDAKKFGQIFKCKYGYTMRLFYKGRYLWITDSNPSQMENTMYDSSSNKFVKIYYTVKGDWFVIKTPFGITELNQKTGDTYRKLKIDSGRATVSEFKGDCVRVQ